MRQTITEREWRTQPPKKAPHRQDEPQGLEPPPPPDMTPRLWRRVAQAYGVTVRELRLIRAAGLTVGEWLERRAAYTAAKGNQHGSQIW